MSKWRRTLVKLYNVTVLFTCCKSLSYESYVYHNNVSLNVSLWFVLGLNTIFFFIAKNKMAANFNTVTTIY